MTLEIKTHDVAVVITKREHDGVLSKEYFFGYYHQMEEGGKAGEAWTCRVAINKVSEAWRAGESYRFQGQVITITQTRLRTTLIIPVSEDD